MGEFDYSVRVVVEELDTGYGHIKEVCFPYPHSHHARSDIAIEVAKRLSEIKIDATLIGEELDQYECSED